MPSRLAEVQPRRPQPILVQLGDLLLIQLANWRWTWRNMVVLGMAAPLLGVAMLGVFARKSGIHALEYVLVGNIVLALLFENQNRVSSNFAFMRARGTLRFFATLPVAKTMVILATALSFMLLSLPAVAVTVLLGSRMLGIPLHVSPFLLCVVPLCALPLAGIGALIGSNSRSPEEAGAISLLATLVLATMGPVILPPDSLPEAVRIAGYLSPATYAASALRQTLLGPVTSRLTIDLAALAAYAGLTLGLAARKVVWRHS
jgi:ABC-2 type transport system permease protein